MPKQPFETLILNGPKKREAYKITESDVLKLRNFTATRQCRSNIDINGEIYYKKREKISDYVTDSGGNLLPVFPFLSDAMDRFRMSNYCPGAYG